MGSGQWPVISDQWSVVSGRWTVAGGQGRAGFPERIHFHTSECCFGAFRPQVSDSLEPAKGIGGASFWNSTCSTGCDLGRLPHVPSGLTADGGVNLRYPPSVLCLQ